MTRLPLVEAEAAAATLVGLLRPGCERIEIAGSVRRKSVDCKDIEVVAVPTFRAGMFGDPRADDLLNEQVQHLARSRALAFRDPRRGEARIPEYKMQDRRYYPLWLPWKDGWFAVDLFVVRPPAQWGAIMAIRTGPADYSQRLVTNAQTQQLRCMEGHLVSTALKTIGAVIDTPEEEDFIRACGMPYLPPEQRR